MPDFNERLRESLDRHAGDMNLPPRMPDATRRRARRRRVATATGVAGGALAAAFALVVVAGSLGGRDGANRVPAGSPTGSPMSSPTGSPTSSPTGSPTGSPGPEFAGVWPQDNLAEAQAAQEAADRGDPGASWQANVMEMLERYGRESLGWDDVFFDESMDIAESDLPGPYTIHIASCEPRDLIEWPPVCTEPGEYTRVAVERLVTLTDGGIWFVTDLEPVRQVELV